MGKPSMPQATVLTVKCAATQKLFGMRVQKFDDSWVSTWAFKLSDETAKSEKYDKGQVNGSIYLGEEYPGCPYCRRRGFIQCGACKKLFDWDGETQKVTCVNCNKELTLNNAGGDFDIEGSNM